MPGSISISQYADAFVIYKISTINIATELQHSLDILNDNLDSINLDISPNKSKICIFNKGHKKHSAHLSIMGKQVVDTVRYVGVWLDRSLRWGRHINEVSKKVLKFINFFKVLAGSSWGVHPKHLRLLYISLIGSRIDYASFFMIVVQTFI